MDYEKLYKEALSRARQFSEHPLQEDSDSIVEYIFPELKESEDERIRRNIIAALKGEGYYDCDLTNECIAWLEKQGEQNLIMAKSPQLGEQKSAKNFVETWKDMRLEVYQQASGNRHEPNYSDDTTKMFSLNDIDEIIEKMSEQKLADKVEPKFNFSVGQWIVATGKCVYLITKIDGFNVTLVDVDGNEYVFDTSSLEDAHLWTIQDAKEGDVLIEDSCIFIIQKLGDNSTAAKTYCTLYNDGDFNDGSILYFDIDSTKPATKEQRDTLERAMADAGYTFDFERKELRKLSQSEVTKMSDQEEIAEIPFGAKDSELQEATYFIPKGFHAEIDDDKVVIKKGEKPATWSEEDELSCFESALFTAFSDAWQSYLLGEEVNVKRWAKEHSKELLEAAKEELKGHNSARSEEDEQIILSIEQAMNCASLLNIVPEKMDKIRTWLKSLKNRVGCEANCTTAKEWNESDKEEFQIAIDTLVKAGQHDSAHWLKSLKQRIGG